jgi:hypothetical protein
MLYLINEGFGIDFFFCGCQAFVVALQRGGPLIQRGGAG